MNKPKIIILDILNGKPGSDYPDRRSPAMVLHPGSRSPRHPYHYRNGRFPPAVKSRPAEF
ncbi:MAG: hypothetical protein P1U87_17430 [Verrucomicrobiales bacterium]|nr:hypothetical protein [Verrucomicrobiales bacterium]